MTVRGIYTTAQKMVLTNSYLRTGVDKLPIFDVSNIFLLESLGEGGSGAVQKAYDKQIGQFIAIKRFISMQRSNENKWVEIMLEDDLLKEIEKIRSSQMDNDQYFLKYYGVYREKEDSLIIKMENGLVSLEDILKAGKTYTCAEVIHIHRKLTEGFVILQENGIANRDVKPGNIILVENLKSINSFHYKISDFGIGCSLKNESFTVSALNISGLTKEYAAPEVLNFYEKGLQSITESDVYNPFLADVFSFGLLTLKLINKKWGRKDVILGNLLIPQNFLGYEQLLVLLDGMLQENPQKRWDFKEILKFHKEREKDPNFLSKIPNEERKYAQKYQIEFLEKTNEIDFEDIEKMYKEHENMYLAYRTNVSLPHEAKFHLDRAWFAIGKMMEKLTPNKEQTFEIQQKTICCLLYFGDWFSVMGNYKSAAEYFHKAKQKIEEFRLEVEQNQIKDEIQYKKISELEAEMFRHLGNLYENKGNLHTARISPKVIKFIGRK